MRQDIPPQSTSPPPEPPTASTRTGRPLWPYLLPLAVPILFFAAYECGLCLTRNAPQIAGPSHIPMLLMLCAICLCVSVGTLLHSLIYWQRPAARLRSMLRQIRNGELPIEEITRTGGGLTLLGEELLLLLRDFKTQKGQIHALQLEMSQRVANRTNALERTISALRHQAVHDPLTGLYNRRMLDEYLPKALQDARQQDENVCVLGIDVDDFKLLNDTLGHAAGDKLLASIGQLIRSSIRDNDCGFRCGGDEFVVVLPGCTQAKGEAIAQRLAGLVDELGRTLHVPRPPRLSIGIAMADGRTDPKELLRRADEAAYQIKRSHKTGRSQSTRAA